MRKFKAVLFILAIAMLLPLIAACNNPSSGNETEPVADTTAEQIEPPYDFMAKFTENGNPLFFVN